MCLLLLGVPVAPGLLFNVKPAVVPRAPILRMTESVETEQLQDSYSGLDDISGGTIFRSRELSVHQGQIAQAVSRRGAICAFGAWAFGTMADQGAAGAEAAGAEATGAETDEQQSIEAETARLKAAHAWPLAPPASRDWHF